MATKQPRKTRTDSATGAVDAAKNATLPAQRPPAHVQISAQAEPHYQSIVLARAREEWDDFQLTIAAQLAQCMADQDEVSLEIVVAGRTLLNARGTLVANPLVNILEALARRQMALARSLQMSGRALGDPRANLNQRTLEKNARSVAAEVAGEDELLAS